MKGVLYLDNKLIGNENNIIFYNDEDGQTQIEVILQNENVWLNIDSLTKLFKIDRTGITKHINNIYKDEELEGIQLVQKLHKFKKREVEALQEIFHIIILI
jgi:hypothetical protein